MSDLDEAQKLADRAGSWENLARGLHELFMLGESTLLNDSFNKEEIRKLAASFGSYTQKESERRGPKRKRGGEWYFRAENILDAAKKQNPLDKERFLIEKHLDLLSEKKVRTSIAARKAAIKTIQNALSEHRKVIKELRIKFGSADTSAFYANIPEGFEGVDDPRIHDVDG